MRATIAIGVGMGILIAAGAENCGSSGVPGNGAGNPGIADPNVKAIVVHVKVGSADQPKHKPIVATIANGPAGTRSISVPIPTTEDREQAETTAVFPGNTYSITLAQSEPGYVSCWLVDFDTKKMVRLPSTLNVQVGTVNCNYTYLAHPA